MKRKLVLVCVVALILSLFSACASGNGEGAGSRVSEESVPLSQHSTVPSLEAKPMVRIGALLGPTGLGLVELMERNDQRETGNIYEFTLAGAPDEITGKIISGELDIAAVPTNLAATLYEKTEHKVQIVAVNTLGVLYLLESSGVGASEAESTEAVEEDDAENDDAAQDDGEDAEEASAEDEEASEEEESAEEGEESTEEAASEETADAVASFEDLRGRDIYSTGQGATQEYVLDYLLRQNDLTPGEDVEVTYRAEHAELATQMLEGKVELALLPEPFVTNVTMKDDRVSTVFDISKEWKSATGTELTMGCIIVRSDFLEKNQAAVDRFLEEFEASAEFAKENVAETAAYSGKFEVIKEDVAKQALPRCNIVCMTGEEMKTAVGAYLDVLYGAEPKSVGGSLPDDGFYYLP